MDLSTEYMGLSLTSPLVPSASVLSKKLENLQKMEDSGAGAVVLHSLFEEQIVQENIELHKFLTHERDSFPESLSFFPEPPSFQLSSQEYLEHIEKAKGILSIPVIASLNGSTKGGWTKYAKRIEEAGADALELNIYKVSTSLEESSMEVEKKILEIINDVKQDISIPLAVKLSPYFTNFAYFAKELEKAGVQGIVLFNRFYQPDFNLEEMTVESRIMLSTPQEMRLPLRWVAILSGRIQPSLAASTGVYSGLDALKLILAGAHVVMVCSSLLKYGIGYLDKMHKEIIQWLEEKEYPSLKSCLGSFSHQNCENPSAFERAHYVNALSTISEEDLRYPEHW
ncbi:MAG: dihydroorotate dehydrogenase-like protein [Planctomycetota bacterium]|nr:MAG: dihydroorotate dehydrogenase-like protein [Planctomycetota bacterium]